LPEVVGQPAVPWVDTRRLVKRATESVPVPVALLAHPSFPAKTIGEVVERLASLRAPDVVVHTSDPADACDVVGRCAVVEKAQ
jgi:hypothetical protein